VEHCRCGPVRLRAAWIGRRQIRWRQDQPPHPSGDAEGETTMGGILLWLIGIPIPLIILLYFIF
jgi:hypothetical protein